MWWPCWQGERIGGGGRWVGFYLPGLVSQCEKGRKPGRDRGKGEKRCKKRE